MTELQKAYKAMSPMEQVQLELKTLDAIVAIRGCSPSEAAILLYGPWEIHTQDEVTSQYFQIQ